MHRRKISKLFLLLVLILVYNASIEAVSFSGPLARFIREGKEVRLPLLIEEREITFSPLDNIVVYVPGSDQQAVLEGKQEYKLAIGRKRQPYWQIQLLATHNGKRANDLKEKVYQKGYSKVRIVKEEDWYKVRLGDYFVKSVAEKTRESLKKDGFQTWLIRNEVIANNSSLKISKRTGEVILEGPAFWWQGTVKINDKIYPGKMEVIAGLDSVDGFVYLKFRDYLNSLVGRQMEEIDLDTETFLYSLAVTTRSKLLSLLMAGEDSSNLPPYPGQQCVNPLASKATEETTGQVLYQDGNIINPEKSIYKLVSLAYSNNNYLKVLKDCYPEHELVDFSQHIKEELKVDAEVEWGLKYQEIRQLTWWGPRVITVLDLDLNRKRFTLKTALAQGKIPGLEDLTQMVEKNNALAGVNGGYFSYTGKPLGLMIHKGRMVSEPIKDRTALGVAEEGEILINRVSWRGIIKISEIQEGLLILNGVNRAPNNNEAVLINNYYGKYAPPIKKDTIQLVVSPTGKVTETNTQPGLRTEIPAHGFIVQARGYKALFLKDVKRGMKLVYKDDFTPDWEEKNIVSALGAGPMLVDEGAVRITAEEEGFQPDIARGRAPRTAAGITADNHILLVTVDGRQPEFSIGMSLEELAKFMVKRGVVSALNLDGGGSARMVVRGFTMNNPSSDRLIGNSFLIKHR